MRSLARTIFRFLYLLAIVIGGSGQTASAQDHPLFTEYRIGVDVTESISIMATVDHMSNADLCDENQGLTNAGVRVGYRW
jgi:hypothetical protein